LRYWEQYSKTQYEPWGENMKTDTEKQVRFIKDLVRILEVELTALERQYVEMVSSKDQEIDELEVELCKNITNGLPN